MKFAVIKNDSDPKRDRLAEALVQKCLDLGHEVGSPEDGIQFVLNLTGVERPFLFRRKSQTIFIFSLVVVDPPPENLRALCYTTLVRTLSNIVLCAVPRNGAGSASEPGPPEVYFTTPECGFYHHPFDPEEVLRRILPIAAARFAIGNRFSADLPARYWETSPVVEEIKASAGELDRLGVLPAPFPLREVLSEETLKQLYALFEIKGLSYGNMSAREVIPELGTTTFWMTARGVDKAKVSKVGRDILLVKGFDYEAGQALVSAPPDYDPRARVSVDAVEHELIYRTFPEVGAIVHVHAWLDGVLCTRQNYPCGTVELGQAVVDLLRQTGCPARTAVGLKNHGLTITGPSLEEIFGRIRDKLQTEVRMMA